VAEDQRENGDAWNDEAGELFTRLGWKYVGSSNMDIPDSTGSRRGLDRIYSFPDGHNSKRDTAVIVEAKRYSPESLQKHHIAEWVNTLGEKVDSMHLSSELFRKYPALRETNLVTGLVAIWFHDDSGNQNVYRDAFERYIQNVSIPQARVRRPYHVKVCVIENSTILRMASMVDAIESWKSQRTEASIDFFYPSSTVLNSSSRLLSALNVAYVLSSFVFAKGTHKKDNKVVTTDIIFNFGKLDLPSFERLSDAVLRHNMMSEQNELVLFNYERDPGEFRKIRDDIEALFFSKNPGSFQMKPMNAGSHLPPWMVEGHTQ
jgi:hypothetical protein